MLRLKLALLPCAALCLMLAVSCGGVPSHVKDRSVTEAELLKEEVARKNIQDENIAIADDYLSQARMKSGMDAINLADLAAAHYRAALAKQSLEASRTSLSQADAALAASDEQVKKYTQIHAEISSGKGE